MTWTTARLRQQDFVDLREVGTRLGWTPTWNVPGRKLTLTGGKGRAIVFEADQRDCYLDGIRIFLSERVTAHRDSLWISHEDLLKTIAPLLRPADQALRLPAPPRLIVLDAGHGGTDPGKSNARHKIHEKDMTLDVVLRLQKLLEAGGYRVLLTRKDDTRFANNPLIDLQRRAVFSNQAVADLFLSIHFNAVDPKDAARVRGSETYVLTPQGMLSTSDEKKDDLTDREFPGNRNDLPNVLLGYHLHRQLINDLKTSDRGYKRARFAVLRLVEAPAALIEAAYLSNDDEAERVGTPEFRQQIAESIARGVDSYAKQLAELAVPR
jgi:N-acetylmuramoyl-L-alanine amidase